MTGLSKYDMMMVTLDDRNKLCNYTSVEKRATLITTLSSPAPVLRRLVRFVVKLRRTRVGKKWGDAGDAANRPGLSGAPTTTHDHLMMV